MHDTFLEQPSSRTLKVLTWRQLKSNDAIHLWKIKQPYPNTLGLDFLSFMISVAWYRWWFPGNNPHSCLVRQQVVDRECSLHVSCYNKVIIRRSQCVLCFGSVILSHAKHLLQRRSIITGIKSKPHLFYLHDLVIFCPIQSSLFSQTIQLQRYREDIHIQKQILNGYVQYIQHVFRFLVERGI